MEKLNELMDWVKNYQLWEKKDYIKIVIGIAIIVMILVGIF